MFQTRTHNTVNENAAIGTGGYGWEWADPVHDAAGNMTTMSIYDSTAGRTLE